VAAPASKEVAKAPESAPPDAGVASREPPAHNAPSFAAWAQESGALAPQDEGFAATTNPEDRW